MGRSNGTSHREYHQQLYYEVLAHHKVFLQQRTGISECNHHNAAPLCISVTVLRSKLVGNQSVNGVCKAGPTTDSWRRYKQSSPSGSSVFLELVVCLMYAIFVDNHHLQAVADFDVSLK